MRICPPPGSVVSSWTSAITLGPTNRVGGVLILFVNRRRNKGLSACQSGGSKRWAALGVGCGLPQNRLVAASQAGRPLRCGELTSDEASGLSGASAEHQPHSVAPDTL